MFVIIGSVTADLLLFSEKLPANLTGDGFQAGNLVFTNRPLTVLMGGNGGNRAYVSGRLGLPTALIGAVGQDVLGDQLLQWLTATGVDTRGLLRSTSHATSTSTIISSGPTRQAVFHHLGSTALVDWPQIPPELLVQAEVLLCSSFHLLPGMRAGGFARTLKTAHRHGASTALDIGPALGELVTVPELTPLFPDLDFLIGNHHELAVLTGRSNLETAASLLLDAGVRCVVIKRGAAGASLRNRTASIDSPGFSVETTVSIGAGDAFNVGFLYGVRQGWALPRSLRFGNAVAALVVSSDRGVLGAPTLDQVNSFLTTR